MPGYLGTEGILQNWIHNYRLDSRFWQRPREFIISGSGVCAIAKVFLKGNGMKVRKKWPTELFIVKWYYYWFQATPHIQLNLIVWKQELKEL